MHKIIKVLPLTLTFEPLLGEPPQQSPTVFAEGGAFVVIHLEPVRHVDLEALLVDLENNKSLETVGRNTSCIQTVGGRYVLQREVFSRHL